MDSIEKEPSALLLKLFLFGILALIPTMILEQLGETYLIGGICAGMSKTGKMAVEYFIVVAWVEEGCKHFFLKRGSWDHPAFDYYFDAIVYSVVVSLGFAAVENIFYVQAYGLHTAIVRAITAIPGHCIFGIFMGHYYGRSKLAASRRDIARSKTNMHLSLIIPIMLHGFYDFSASMENDLWIIAFFIYIIILDVLAIRSIKRYAQGDTRIY